VLGTGVEGADHDLPAVRTHGVDGPHDDARAALLARPLAGGDLRAVGEGLGGAVELVGDVPHVGLDVDLGEAPAPAVVDHDVTELAVAAPVHHGEERAGEDGLRVPGGVPGPGHPTPADVQPAEGLLHEVLGEMRVAGRRQTGGPVQMPGTRHRELGVLVRAGLPHASPVS
jgi:hypothetical protein